MTARRHTRAAVLLCLTFLFAQPCLADEIEFQNPKTPQNGVVVKEDADSVTIRFQRQVIKSITRRESESSSDPGDLVIWQQTKDYLILKIPRGSIQIVPQQAVPSALPSQQEPVPSDPYQSNGTGTGHIGPPEPVGTAEAAPSSTAATDMTTQQSLLQEEMGSVQGVIKWKKMPLSNARVKIVLERYTGFSMAAVKRWYESKGTLQQEDPFALETCTDATGHYLFPQAPPGYYRLHWMPDASTGWVHRLRENPDLEVISGNRTIGNVPEKMQ